MNFFVSPFWIQLTAGLPFAAAAVLLFVRTPSIAARWSTTVLAVVLGFAAIIFTAHTLGATTAGRGQFAVDDISSPMLPVVLVLHLLAMLGTAKARVSPQFCARLLLSAGFAMAALLAQSGALLVGILSVAVLLPWWDLKSRGQRTRGYAIYMGLFLALLLAGWFNLRAAPQSAWPVALLLLALLLRGGIVPLHGWMPSLFQNAAFGSALVFVLPLTEVIGVFRLLIPHAHAPVMEAGGIACLVTALYGGGLAIVQQDSRRFFACIGLSQTSMVLYAVLMRTPNGLTAALCLWISAPLALAGLAFSLRALEARFGSLSLREHHGFYEQVPGLAICFLITGLASVGFPGTIGFVPMELLVTGSVERSLWITVVLVLAAMFNAIAIMRAYFALFTGRSPTTSISLRTTPAERIGIILISLIVFLGGWFSPPVVESRHRIANQLLGEPAGAPVETPTHKPRK